MVAVRYARAVQSGFAVLMIVCPAGMAAPQDGPHSLKPVWPLVHIPDPVANRAARDALDMASAWLAKPACRAVLTDFHDQDGRFLAERLVALHVDLQTYLSMVVFIDGTRHVRCDSAALAFTVPGSRVVRVCVDELKRGWQQDRAYTIAGLIHEMLHTLGLGENPPSSKEITARVGARCGQP